MNENPYEAPKEKLSDRPFSLKTWRIVHWVSLIASTAVLMTAFYFDVFHRGASLVSLVVLLVVLVLMAVVFFADWKVRRQIK
jgi:membrane protein YdbS with pleckstrin-like domain